MTKVYGEGDQEVRALSDIDLELHGGHIYGLLGPNGAGKTTFLRICATLLQPTSGDAWVAGHHTVDEARDVRARLGYLSSSTGVYQRLNPVELMRYFGRLYGLTPAVIEERTDGIFTDLGIDAFRDRPLGKLSTGMRQKVSIARTFLPEPPVMILDEPTNGLDVVVRQSLLDLLTAQSHAGRLIILSTHDLPEAEEVCDHFIVIDRGRVLAQGSREALLGGGHDLREIFFEALAGDGEQVRAT